MRTRRARTSATSARAAAKRSRFSPPSAKIWRAAAKARIPRAAWKAWFTSTFNSSSRLTKFILTEQIRQLRTIAYTRPFEFPRRVFILDEAQTIHWQAVDLLLKVLEEPPETTSFILICPNAYELRSTIRSRCMRIAFQPVEQALIRTSGDARRSSLIPEGSCRARGRGQCGPGTQFRPRRV